MFGVVADVGIGPPGLGGFYQREYSGELVSLNDS